MQALLMVRLWVNDDDQAESSFTSCKISTTAHHNIMLSCCQRIFNINTNDTTDLTAGFQQQLQQGALRVACCACYACSNAAL